jgi:predicted transcriptional regulator
MRTTINIDDDLLEKLKQEAERARMPLRVTLNRALRLGLERLSPEAARRQYQGKTFAMGFPPLADLDKALQLAALLEDEETLHKLALRK